MSEQKPTYNTRSLPNYAEWLDQMGAAGWVGGVSGWITFPATVPPVTMRNNEAMEFFRLGITPPPPEWDDINDPGSEVLPFAEGKGGCDE